MYIYIYIYISCRTDSLDFPHSLSLHPSLSSNCSPFLLLTWLLNGLIIRRKF